MIVNPRTGYGKTIQRRRAVRVAVSVAIAALLVGTVVFLARSGLLSWGRENDPDQALKLWNSGEWRACYDEAGVALEKHALDAFWLTLRGFSAYQLAADQVAPEQAAPYLEDAVFSLRKALITGPSKMEGRVRYVLGKAYYQRGRYYADQALTELEQARNLGYEASDLDEQLGLAAAELGRYRDSIVYLSRSLGEAPSDLLLLAIARSYAALEEYASAEAYYRRCIDDTKDSDVEAGARVALSSALIAQGRLDDAEAALLPVLESDASNVDALMELGDLYAKKGDSVKARAEWRRVVKIDPANVRARARLSM